MLHLTLTILRASTTKAPRLSLNTFLLLRSKEWQRPFADMTLVRADVSTLLKPSSFCSASSCSPAQAMEISLPRCQAKFGGMTIDHQTCQKDVISDCLCMPPCQTATWQISVASVAWSKPSYSILSACTFVCANHTFQLG